MAEAGGQGLQRALTLLDDGKYWCGLEGDALAYLLGLHARKGRWLVVLPDEPTRVALERALSFFVRDSARVAIYAGDDVRPYAGFSPAPERAAERLHTIALAQRVRDVIVLTSATSLASLTLTTEAFEGAVFVLRVGDDFDREALAARLTNGGYLAVSTVREVGTFAVRGDILDVWPNGAKTPVRIDFFDVEIESIRRIHPASQRASTPRPSVTILPMREEVLDDAAANRFSRTVAPLVATIPDGAKVRRRLVEDLLQGVRFGGVEAYLPGLHETTAPLDHFARFRTLVVDPEEVYAALREFERTREARYQRLDPEDRPMLPPKQRYQTSKETIAMLASASPVKGLAIQENDMDLGARAPMGLSVTGADLAPSVHKIKGFVEMGMSVHVVAVSESRAEGIVEMFSNHELDLVRENDAYARHREGVRLMIGDLPAGFVAPRSGVAFIPASALFGEGRKRRSRVAHAQFNASVADLSQLQDGGLVVHRLHGVGRYEGLARLTIQGDLGHSKGGRASTRPKAMADYLKLSYRNGELLYVPATDLGSLSRYVGAKEGQKIKLDKLGGTTWESRKRRVRDSVLQMAQGLISQAAQRELARREPLPPRGEMMQLFEARFPFQETPDQRDAIAAIESDFARPVPMDRLVVGDVGFGKTEVAMRATMRMVEAGKQVAVLVPTTVLAMQHAERFVARFKPFDVRVELLSRFRSGSEVKKIHRELLTGEIQIVVGTTQLLGKSVRYHDLGLLVVDEEHRYGVRQKSRLSNLADGLDILSLSATPIPRTLQMGLTGMRSLSTITTPPAARLSVQTSLGKYSEARIRDAIMSELERKGQVFFVHNKVVEIEEMASQLRALMPEVRIAVGHGQMEAVELEDVLLRFMRREVDLLLSSTIIESGIDLPNVNTIIINDAHLFGLSQLYQLRGRVGRGDKRGRCLMVLPETVSKGARRRLSVLLDNTALGSGFQVALADLEIRGAGNLLGAAQSGNIAEVGYEMWLELLTAAVAEAKGEQARGSIEVAVEVPVDCFIPATTIRDTAERLGWYQRLAKERVLELDASEEAMENQFGELPEPLRNLLGSHRTRALCQGLGVVRCSWLKVRVELALHPLTRIDEQTVKRFQESHPNRLKTRVFNGIRMLDVAVIASEEQKRFHFLRWLLSQLSAASRPPKTRLH